jgi:hypothetical protein
MAVNIRIWSTASGCVKVSKSIANLDVFRAFFLFFFSTTGCPYRQGTHQKEEEEKEYALIIYSS